MQRLTVFFLFCFLLFSVQPVFAQDPSQPPVYVVQKGDTLSAIAARFGVTVDALKQANDFANPDILSPGTDVVIPGLTGVHGRLTTDVIALGENLQSLSIRRQVPASQIVQLNHLTSPMEAFAGARLIIPDAGDKSKQPQPGDMLQDHQSLLELAAINGQNPWLLTELNQFQQSSDLLPGEVVFFPAGDAPKKTFSPISPLLKNLEISPLPLVQGDTTTIKIAADQALELTGSLAGNKLNFFPNGDHEWVTLQGIYALAGPGLVPLIIQGKFADGRTFSFEQMVVLQAGGYATERIAGVDPVTLDPANTKPENDQVAAIVAPITPKKYWDGVFSVPGYDPKWITSWFGTRRMYNADTVVTAFHTGLDYGGGPGLEIKADAPGVVVFAGPMLVRGNATFIDHGWGVYSAFYHQSAFKVNVGDVVESGQVIGLYGGTGRVTGPHLHWEIWVNSVQVDPQVWLTQAYP